MCINRLDPWNEKRGINGIAEREEVVDLKKKKRKFEVLAFNETKLKGNGGVMVWNKLYHCKCSRD